KQTNRLYYYYNYLGFFRQTRTSATVTDKRHTACYRVRNPKYLIYFKTLVVVRVKVGRQVITTMSDRVKLIKTVKESEMRLKGILFQFTIINNHIEPYI